MLKSNVKLLVLTPPETLCYFDLKLSKMFFFGLVGWLQSVKIPSFVHSLKKRLLCTLTVLPVTLNNLIFGLIKSYFKYIQLRGRSFRYLYLYTTLVLKLGFSHKLYYIVANNTCITVLTKQVIKVVGKTVQRLSLFFFDLHVIRKFDKYKGKGLLYYNDSILLKPSSKKTKV
jgi:ribosomal protein L6P/L9E